MPSYYTCFFHPQETRDENSLDDLCPTCNRPYKIPLDAPPEKIRDYRIVRPLGRGFYGATYLVESGNLGAQDVLKVVPAPMYTFFEKDFEAECKLHKEVAEETEHVVSIRDMFDEDVVFDGDSIPCHIAVLDYVPGISLSEFVEDENAFQARAVAQVAIDLLRLLQELETKQRYHNDLHGDNIRIKQLGEASRRADAIDESIRAVAIDLGSLSDASKSDPGAVRLGDLHEVAKHLLDLSERLLRNPDAVDDLEYRLAFALREIGLLLAPEALHNRVSLRDCEQLLIEASASSISPWRPPGKMRRFSAAFNAQTMHAWFIPRFLVDPDDEWLTRVSLPMPTVISGIRGCGKTMLLRALQFHARASEGEDGQAATKSRLENDDYVGLYVSCNRLLDGPGGPQDGPVHEPYARLFVAYAREAVQAARHLREVDRDSVRGDYHRLIAEVVADHLEGASDLANLASEASLERVLQRQLVSLAKGEKTHAMRANPAVAFPQLAEAIRRCSPLWENSAILFLLDDVSTRHLNEASIEKLLSSLLFKDETCAFKLTTEAQTLELLLSPGLIEKLQLNRDVDLFDLGREVNERLRDRTGGRGRQFISDILARRARQLENHPTETPEQLLGRATLESIAQNIAGGKRESRRDRQGVYHGIGALQAACVGDIGDAIAIYELIYRSWDRDGRKSVPIERDLQSKAYQDYCIRCLYHLNRRATWLRDISVSFARAANQLLTQSYRKREIRGGKGRLRQYATVHVDLTGADKATSEKLRELIDAGVFVFDRGPMSPRAKAADEDPVSQFILTYRKLYGLSSYIGLSERDRFELSAAELKSWFANPADETCLTRKLGGVAWEPSDEDVEEVVPLEVSEEDEVGAPRLFDDLLGAEGPPTSTVSGGVSEQEQRTEAFLEHRIASTRLLSEIDLKQAGIASVMAGLGFEDRTEVSAKRVFDAIEPVNAVLFEYKEPGYAEQILSNATAKKGIDVVPYLSASHADQHLPPGPILIDVTGMPKSLIFGLVRRALQRDGRVVVTHTQAETHYPLNKEIQKIRREHDDLDAYAILEAAHDEIFSGDGTPYLHVALLPGGVDAARRRLLCAGASAKHERLLSLLDYRDYDHLELLVPAGESQRTWLAKQAAAVARREADMAEVHAVDGDDPGAILRLAGSRYRLWYGLGGFDVELGLTGSKIQAVAFAALSATLKVAQCWYIQPATLDPKRFSSGVAATRHFEITLPPAPTSDP